VGTTTGFRNQIIEASSPIITPLNPVVVPAVLYEYLLCHPSSDRLWPPARRKARGLLSGSCTPSTAGHRLRPNNLDTSGSLQQQNGWGTIHHIRYDPTTSGKDSSLLHLERADRPKGLPPPERDSMNSSLPHAD
jgi:hypothetical protein